jgi:hypothetical protein
LETLQVSRCQTSWKNKADTVFMRAGSAHCVQLDYGAVNWPEEAEVVIADTSSINAFSKHVEGDKLAVYVWGDTLTQPLPENGRTLIGVAAASIDFAPRSRSTISVVIHALAIKDSSQGLGLDQLLYEQLHQALFELGQQEYARSVFQAKQGDEQEPGLPLMELHILPVSCRQCARALVLYANNHWRLACNGGTACVPKDVLKEWARDGTPLYVKYIELSLPPISLRYGFFSSSFDIDSRIVGTIPSFTEDSAVRDARCGTNFVGQLLLTEIKVIGPSLRQLSPHTGLLPFFVPAAPCRALDDFLLDPRNWIMTRGGGVGRTLRVGSARLGGFNQYDNINSNAHDPAMQAVRTARTFNGAELKELHENAPGFAMLTSAVLGHLGYPECSPERLFSMLKSVHFFLVDESRQTSFAWHTDDTDLDITQRDVKLNLRSAVIQLGAEARSAMQVLGFRPFSFEGRGAGALFHGAAVHRSIDLEPPPHAIWKVTLFLVLPLSA